MLKHFASHHIRTAPIVVTSLDCSQKPLGWLMFTLADHCIVITAPSGVVQNLRHDDIGTTEVTLLWDEVSCALRGGPLEHYDVIVRDVTRDIRFTQQHTSERRLHVDNLAPYWRYAVRVSYVNGEGAGPPSAEHILTTKQDGTYLSICLFVHCNTLLLLVFSNPRAADNRVGFDVSLRQ